MTPFIDQERAELSLLLAIHDDLERRLRRLCDHEDALHGAQRAVLRDSIDRTDRLLRKIDTRIRLAAERALAVAPTP
jgi:hypothetical protein